MFLFWSQFATSANTNKRWRSMRFRRIIFIFTFMKVDVHLRDKATVKILILHRQARSFVSTSKFVFAVLSFREILKLNYNNSEIFVASLRYVRKSMFQWEIFERFFKGDVKNSFWRISGDKILLEGLIWINCSIRISKYRDDINECLRDEKKERRRKETENGKEILVNLSQRNHSPWTISSPDTIMRFIVDEAYDRKTVWWPNGCWACISMVSIAAEIKSPERMRGQRLLKIASRPLDGPRRLCISLGHDETKRRVDRLVHSLWKIGEAI